ncbi:hypothetical protein, partial [Staphylococcus epidermidis]|uniref:hypothetical protein n=1 Tax=Staphylococcus epidermidis TaxID=1282 RepID=UPI0030EBEABF
MSNRSRVLKLRFITFPTWKIQKRTATCGKFVENHVLPKLMAVEDKATNSMNVPENLCSPEDFSSG